MFFMGFVPDSFLVDEFFDFREEFAFFGVVVAFYELKHIVRRFPGPRTRKLTLNQAKE